MLPASWQIKIEINKIQKKYKKNFFGTFGFVKFFLLNFFFRKTLKREFLPNGIINCPEGPLLNDHMGISFCIKKKGGGTYVDAGDIKFQMFQEWCSI